MPCLFLFNTCFGRHKSSESVTDAYTSNALDSTKSFDLRSKESLSSSASFKDLKELINHGAMIFKYRELRKATDNFNTSRTIGTSVYRATVRNIDVVIAKQKWIKADDILDKLKESCTVHHTSLAKLLGACISEIEHLYLVYEYIDGVNLKNCLKNGRTTGFCLLDSWTKRLQVALDIAKGLEYMHDHTHSSFIHKYIKSSNIIIGNDLRGNIGMFAAAQLTGDVASTFPRSQSLKQDTEESNFQRSDSIKITGTPGYMAPEYIASGIVTTKADVLAFGVVLLELLSGKEPFRFQYDAVLNIYTKISLPEMILALLNSQDAQFQKLRLWIDPVLRDSYPVSTAYDVAVVAKSCVDADPEKRPQMRDVAVKLSKALVKSQKWEKSMAATRDLQSKEIEGR